ncbi:hypothetical protein LCGC14_2112300 [marine sediment metagenome]|uniref:Uncharacterized protein n=2 Tax=root TaxID=1 RepID=A0A831VQK4_9FLAO|nr:hypothetical protein [Pricia antarctica]
MIRKELHLDEMVVSALEAEAKRQNRSLKNYLEFLAIEQAKKLEVPSREYTDMMDDLLNKFDKNEIEFSSIEEVMSRNGISN